jgi:hypothetical protein
MKVSKITSAIAGSIDKDIKAALAAVEEKWGVNIAVGGGTYTNDSFTTKLKVSVAGVDMAKKEWDRYAFRFGLKDEQYGTTFQFSGETFTVAGIRPKARKQPIIGTNARGTRYTFPASALK